MYAVIRAGGKQHKVAEGDIIEVEKISGSGTVSFTPLLIVDDKGKVRSGKAELGKATVSAKIIEDTKGPKVHVFKYKNKTGYRRNTGHRQKYTRIEISGIKLSGGTATETKEPAAKAASTAKTTTTKTTARTTTAKAATGRAGGSKSPASSAKSSSTKSDKE